LVIVVLVVRIDVGPRIVILVVVAAPAVVARAMVIGAQRFEITIAL
jgi:hypothetical protein